MGIRELVLANRTCRRFHEAERVSMETLEQLVELARLSPSAANLQPLRYALSTSPGINARIFATLGWAAYLKDWPGPAAGERPPAYIVILSDERVSRSVACDHGIAAQRILLGAVEQGLAGCILASVKRDELREILQIPDKLHILLVLALGKPAETRVIEELGPDRNIRYYLDGQGVHHVPKRNREDIIIGRFI